MNPKIGCRRRVQVFLNCYYMFTASNYCVKLDNTGANILNIVFFQRIHKCHKTAPKQVHCEEMFAWTGTEIDILKAGSQFLESYIVIEI